MHEDDGVASLLLVSLPGILMLALDLWPVLVLGQLPAVYDVLMQYYPAAVVSHLAWTTGQIPFWNPFHALGEPFLANPAFGVLYPVDILLYTLFAAATALRIYIVFHILLMYFATFAYARTTGTSRTGAVYAAVAYTFSGYVVARIAWLNFLSSYALLPVIFYLLERSFRARTWGRLVQWALVAGMCLGMAPLSGSQQVAFYIGLAIGGYSLWQGSKGICLRKPILLTGRLLRCLLAATITGIVGGGLFAMQLLPSLEFLGSSNYSVDYAGQVEGGLRLSDLGLLIYGAGPGEVVSFYIGGAVLLLAVFAVLHHSSRLSWFFGILTLFTAAISIRLPAYLQAEMFHIPGFAQFGAHWPERSLILAVFSIGLLAGRGVDDLFLNRAVGRRQLIAFSTAAIVVLLALDTTPTLGMRLPPGSLRFLGFFALSLAAIIVRLIVGARARLLQLALLGIVMADLAVGFRALQYPFTDFKQHFSSSATAPILERFTRADPQRVVGIDMSLPWDGYDSAVEAPNLITGNSSWTFGLADAQGYNPLHLRTYANYLAALNRGLPIDYHILGVENLASPLIKFLDVGYLVTNSNSNSNSNVVNAILVGSTGLSQARPRWEGPSGSPWRVDRITVISSLANSSTVPQGQEIGRIEVRGTTGTALDFPIRAGVDTAEWAYDRPDVRKVIRHERANIFGSSDTGQGFSAHSYVTTLVLPQSMVISSVGLELIPYTDAPGLAWQVNEVSTVLPLTEIASTTGDFNGYRIWRIKDSLPAAYVTPFVDVVRNSDEILRLMQDAAFNPRLTALISEDPPPSIPHITGGSPETVAHSFGSARIVGSNLNRVQIQTTSPGPGMLILANNYYSGWQATIDGEPSRVYRVDYTFLGVAVPAGTHSVVFYYRDAGFLRGAAISFLTILCSVVLYMLANRLDFFRVPIAEGSLD